VPNRHGGSGGGKLTGKGDPNLVKHPNLPGKRAHGGVSAGPKGHAAPGRHSTPLNRADWLVALAAALLVLLAPTTARRLLRRRRMLGLRGPHPDPAAAWAELRDTAIDAGAPWDDERSPRQSAYAFGRWLDAPADVRGALGRLTRAEEEHRYSAAATEVPSSLAGDVRTVRLAVRTRQSHRRAMRAWLLPPSTLRMVSGRWVAALDGLADARPGRRLRAAR
jgi:hypothetical protein